MDEKTLRFRVGVVVLVAAIILGILVMRNGDIQFPGTSKYTIFIDFRRAPGVQVGTPVRKDGISIGRVTSVELLDEGGVEVTADIEARRKIRASEVCRIASASVLGDPVLEFFAADKPDKTAPLLENGSQIQGELSGNPLEILDNLQGQMKEALVSIRNAGADVSQVSRNLNTALANNDDQIPRLFQKAERSLDQLHKTLSTVDELFGDVELRDNLKKSIAGLPKVVELFDKAGTTLSKANDSFDSLREMTGRADKNLANLEKFTEPLAARGPGLVEDIDGILSNVNSLTETLDNLVRGFDAKKGVLGRVLNDEELADKITSTVNNINDISVMVKPILADARVFSDKIARDPGIIGVRGALDRRAMGTGNKQPTIMAEPASYQPVRSFFHRQSAKMRGQAFAQDAIEVESPVISEGPVFSEGAVISEPPVFPSGQFVDE